MTKFSLTTYIKNSANGFFNFDTKEEAETFMKTYANSQDKRHWEFSNISMTRYMIDGFDADGEEIYSKEYVQTLTNFKIA